MVRHGHSIISSIGRLETRRYCGSLFVWGTGGTMEEAQSRYWLAARAEQFNKWFLPAREGGSASNLLAEHLV